MAALYSALLFEGHDMGPTQFVVLDPAYVWIVRDIDAFQPGPSDDGALSVVTAVTSGTLWEVNGQAVGPHGNTYQWRGRQVFVPPSDGVTLIVNSGNTTGGWDCRISGYRLTPT